MIPIEYKNFSSGNNEISAAFKGIPKFIFLILIVSLGQLSCTQEKVEHRNSLEKYDNGQLMQELVKYKDKDTLVEFVYFQDGQLNAKRQILDNKRTGWSEVYNKNGELLFQGNYLNGNLIGDFKAFYPTGEVSRIKHYQENKNIDTTTYYDIHGQVTKKVIYLTPCEFSSSECHLLVLVYEDGSKIYSYEVKNGLKSENHTVFDQTAYLKLKPKTEEVSMYQKGKTIFQENCGMCHLTDKQPVGMALDSFPRTTNKDELSELFNGSKGHPMIKINEKKILPLIEYINKNRP